MIYYFSATGNNKYVAQRIAEAIGGTITVIFGVMALFALMFV